MFFYAVAKGVKTGIYNSWPECELQVKGFKGAKFKKFKTQAEAEEFIKNAQPTPAAAAAPNSPGKRNVLQQSNNNSKQLPVTATTATNNEYSALLEEDEDLLLALPIAAADANAGRPVAGQTTRRNKTAARKRKLSAERDATANKRIKISGFNYKIDAYGYVKVYIAGHSENVGAWNGIAGYGVAFDNKHPLNTFGPATGRVTHNVGDIVAAVEALKLAKAIKIPKLCLLTSSKFLLDCIGSWMFHWQRNDWRNKNGKVVGNKKELMLLNELLTGEDAIPCRWEDLSKMRGEEKQIKEVELLARCGADEYLDNHPAKKDDSFDSLDSSCDFY